MSALAVLTLSFLSVVLPAVSARATDIPVTGNPVYFQTQGPDDQIGYGDYYSASVAQGGAGTDHMVSFVTPSAWPTAHPITVAIYDPESWGGKLASGLPAGDEVRNVNDKTTYWIVERPSGTTLTTKTYAAGASATNGLWDQLITFTPTAGATYEIHTTTGGDDENSWRARISYDPDCTVGTNTCTAAKLDNGNQVDDVDGVSGTGDELFLNAVRVGYQHDSATDVCNNHYFFVPDTMASVTMRNFDLDSTGTVTYTRGDGSVVAGTPSGNGVWALDTVPVGAGQSGWWTVQFCYNSGNLYVFESTQNLRLYMDTLPGAPTLAVTKTDGVTSAEWGQALNYTVNVANTSNLKPNPGSAVGVVVRDTIPNGLTYTGCSMGGAAGSCAQSAGVVTWTLTNPITAGASVNVGVSTTVNWGFSGTVTNTATADYNDVYGNNYPDVSGSDSADTIQPPTFVVTKTSNTGGDLVGAGDRVTYTVEIKNPTTSTHTNVKVTDVLPAGTTYVPGSTVVALSGDPVVSTATDDFASGGFAGGAGWVGPWTGTGGGGPAAPGAPSVFGGALWFTDVNSGVHRTVSVAGATSATLSFTLGVDYVDPASATQFGWGVGVNHGSYQQVGVQARNPAPNPTTVTVDLSSYLPATTLDVWLRGLAGIDFMSPWYSVDNVVLTVTTPSPVDVRTNAAGGTLESGEPPTLVTAGDGIDLPAGKTMTVTYDVDVTSPMVSATQRYLTNTATVTSDEDTAGSQGSVTDEIDRTPILDVVKSGPSSALVGDTVTYTFAVSHATASDGSPVSGVTLADDVAGTPTYVSGDDGDGLLEAGETWTYTKDYTIASGDPSPLINTVTVGGIDLNGQAIPVATASHSTTVTMPAPSISLTKTTSDSLTAGGTITYLLTAHNTGNVTLTGVQISDGLAGAVASGPCSAVTLLPGATTSCTFTYLASQADVDAGSLTNSGSVTGTPPTGANVTDSDVVTLTGSGLPAISLTKTTAATGFAAGDVIDYTLTARNTGTLTLSNVTITDALAGAAFVGNCDPTGLAPGTQLTCAAQYTATQADVDAGSIKNTASVVGTPPGGADDNVTATDAVTLTATAAPAITLTKSASTTSLVAGDTVTYTLDAQNTGNVTLTGVKITDGLTGVTVVDPCVVANLAPGATTSCTFTYVVKQSDVDAGALTNTASVVGTPPSGADDNVTATDAVTLTSTAAPSISLSKTTSDTLTAGGTITYVLTAKNTGGVTLTGVQISDDLASVVPVGACDAVTLAPGATTSCAFTYVASQADVDAGALTNTASVVGTPPSGTDDNVTAADAVTLTADGAPAITLTKSPSAKTAQLDEVITYSLTARNTGNVTLSDVTITDSLPGVSFVGDCLPTTLAPDAELTCTAKYTVTRNDLEAGSVVNDANVTGTPPTAKPVGASASATVAAVGDPAIDVEVTVNRPQYGSFGEVLTFTVVTKNTGNVTLYNTTLASTLIGADTTECDAVDATLLPGESVTCLVRYTVVLADLYAPDKALDVVASGQSNVRVSVHAASAARSTPVVALAFTGADVAGPTRFAAVFVFAGTLLVLFASRSRRKGKDA